MFRSIHHSSSKSCVWLSCRKQSIEPPDMNVVRQFVPFLPNIDCCLNEESESRKVSRCYRSPLFARNGIKATPHGDRWITRSYAVVALRYWPFVRTPSGLDWFFYNAQMLFVSNLIAIISFASSDIMIIVEICNRNWHIGKAESLVRVALLSNFNSETIDSKYDKRLKGQQGFQSNSSR